MKKKEQMLSEYEIDNIWMSYRYCIGRHTIAAHCHAGDIANNAYGRMTKERMQFMAKDINQEIYDCLHVHDWFCVFAMLKHIILHNTHKKEANTLSASSLSVFLLVAALPHIIFKSLICRIP